MSIANFSKWVVVSLVTFVVGSSTVCCVLFFGSAVVMAVVQGVQGK